MWMNNRPSGFSQPRARVSRARQLAMCSNISTETMRSKPSPSGGLKSFIPGKELMGQVFPMASRPLLAAHAAQKRGCPWALQAGEGDAAGGRPAMAAALDAAVAKLRAVLDRMLELESINEVIERLRGVIRVQEQIRDDTLERQRRRGREALESP
jgi:hypothetical protein